MQNTNVKSFLCGVLACLMVIGLCATVTAATTSISVSYGTKVLFNGQAFQPKDNAGRNVQLITYDGTVYAPIRAVCEKAGLRVEYDAATKTASIMTADYVPPKPLPQPAPGSSSMTIAGMTVTGNLGFLQGDFWTDGDGQYLMEELAASGVTSMVSTYYTEAQRPEYGCPIYILAFIYEGQNVGLVLDGEHGEPMDEIEL